MNKIIKSIIIVSCSFLVLGYAHAGNLIKTGRVSVSGKTFQKIDVTGGTNLVDIKANSVDVTGGLTFTNLEVFGDIDITGNINRSSNLKCKNLKVTGGLEAQNIECKNTLKVTGGVKLENVQASLGKIIGEINIKKGTFEELNLTGKSLVLEDVNVNSIVVEKGSNANKGSESVITINGVVINGLEGLNGINIQEGPNGITINGVDINDVAINEVRNSSDGEILHLKGSTIVSGDIIFKSGKGTLIIDEGAQFLGTVIGLKPEIAEL